MPLCYRTDTELQPDAAETLARIRSSKGEQPSAPHLHAPFARTTPMRDLKLALRTLARTPFVTAVAVLSLALGIGANAAIFSMFDRILLSPLPVHEPERLVNLSAPGPKPGSNSCNQAGDCEDVFSYAMFRDLEEAETGFAGVAAHRLFGTHLSYRNLTLNAEGMLVSGSYFPLLGLSPALGRLIGPSDDQVVAEHPVAVLSYAFWENQLGADPAVLNQTVMVNGHPLTIIGVAPRGFDGTTLGGNPYLFVPLTMRSQMESFFTDAGFDNRRNYWAYVFARLAPGVTPELAQEAVNRVYGQIINEVEAPLQQGMSEETLAQFRAKQITLAPGRRGQSSVHAEAKTPLMMLFGVTGVVLLIACANIANLLLARGAGRGAEIAIRGALGAGRGRLLVQLLTEACLLAALGGAASLLVAWWTLDAVTSFLPPEAASALQFRLEPSVVLFAAAMSLGTGLLFGLYPALHSTRPDLVTALKASTGQPSGARSAARFRTSLVTGQIALSMTLLVLAGLFIKSLSNVSRVELGIRTDNVVTFGISPQLSGYDPDRTRTLFERVEEELAATPGVSTVSAALVPALAGSNWNTSVSVEGFPTDPDVDRQSSLNRIGPGYFATLGTPLVAGREFTLADDAAGQKVAIVNEAFARKFGLDPRQAVGKWMSTGGGDELDVQIVGVARDAKYSEVKQEVPPVFFTPWRQAEGLGFINFYARTAVEPGQVMGAVRELMTRLDPDLPVENLKTLEQQARESVFLDRMISTLSAAFAGLATLLASIGLYGVLAYTVAQRTREIGLRMALGAASTTVRMMVLRQVAFMALVGGAVGVLAAVLLGRAARSLLFELEGHDPFVITTVTLVLAAVALGAAYVPARRASRVEPMKALRYE
jgi:predicted permease